MPFWSRGISNPLEVIEQITYLLFLRRLDDMHTLEENKANRLKKAMERRVFPEGKDAKGRSYGDFRWSRFKHFAPAEMLTVVGEHVFPYLRTDLARQLGGADSTYAHHMKDARFTIPTPALLAKVVDPARQGADGGARHPMGDIYEYMLGKIATAGQNGQFRTPAPYHPADGGADRSPSPPTSSATRPAARRASWSRRASTCASATRTCCTTRSCASTSTAACSTASTSTTPCCASAA